jgi:uncharacterized tellurite resistance protein B-like protein
MLRSLKALFETGFATLALDEVATDEVALAVAALLLEIARADHVVDTEEERAIVQAVARSCGVESEAIADMLASAQVVVDEAVSLYDFTAVINQHLSHPRKLELLTWLWRVAQADGRLDHYEEYYIRKAADLLHLSHKDFIGAKLAAERTNQ